MIVKATKDFQKDLRNCPVNIQKRTVEIIKKLKSAEDLKSANVDSVKIAGQKKTLIFAALEWVIFALVVNWLNLH